MNARLQDLQVGDSLPERRHTATNVSLFMYNAAIWNPHRIHYDEPYTVNEEKYPGVVIDGPLQGDWLMQVVTNWIGEDGQVMEFEYTNRRASYLGETLTASGGITAIDDDSVSLELFIRNEAGDVITPGKAMVRFG